MANLSEEKEWKRSKNLAILKNTHHTFKLYWQILMGLVLAISVEGFYTYLSVFKWSFNDFFEINNIFIWCNYVLVFLTTYIRFFWGDCRYLDEHYNENFVYDNKTYDEFVLDFPPRRRVIDLSMLTFHGIIFMIMAYSIFTPLFFYSMFFLLMASNVIWLAISQYIEDKTEESRTQNGKRIRTVITETYENEAPIIWRKNNLLTAGLMLVLYLIWLGLLKDKVNDDSLLHFGLLIICILNCIRDMSKTKLFYFPVLRDPD